MTERRSQLRKKSQNVVLWALIVLGLLLLGTAAGVIHNRYPNLISDAVVKLTPGNDSSPEATPFQPPSRESIATPKLVYQGVQRLLETLTPARRTQLLGDAEAFERLVREESARRSVLEAARTAGLTQDVRVTYLMERAAAQILFNTYVQAQANSNLPADFPSEAQIKKYFEQNRSKYRFEQHVPVWQIFISVSLDTSSEQRTQKEMLASDLSDRIRAGTLTFANAAISFSEHEASRMQGGYIGAIRMSQLLPEVRTAIPQLEEDEVSRPIRTKGGYHIIRRGAVMTAQDMPLDQLRDTIELELRRAALFEIQQAVLKASENEYGKPLTKAELDEWRRTLSATLTQSD
jgi:peptidylprolyl isomerase